MCFRRWQSNSNQGLVAKGLKLDSFSLAVWSFVHYWTWQVLSRWAFVVLTCQVFRKQLAFKIPMMKMAWARSHHCERPCLLRDLDQFCLWPCLVEPWSIELRLVWYLLTWVCWRLIDLETILEHRSWDLSWFSNLSCSEKRNWREEEDRKTRRRYEVTQEGVWKVWVARLYSVWIT